MKKYHKIETPFRRDPKTKELIRGNYRNHLVEYLDKHGCEWLFTEKVDGTNVRVHWDGYEVTFAGRTDNAQFHPTLQARLEELFLGEANAQLFEEIFGEKEATLYGEGYGPKIQKGGGKYRDDVSFILFDVMVNDKYLRRFDVVDVASKLGIDYVPNILCGTIDQAIDFVLEHEESFIAQNGHELEGVVGTPKVPLLDANGKRVIIKIRREDFL